MPVRLPRWRSLAAWAGGAALALAVTGCGGGPTLDAPSASAQVAGVLAARFGPPAPQVHCPRGVAARPGTRFTCTAQLDGQRLGVTGTVVAKGRFTVTLDDAVLVVGATQHVLGGDLRGAFGGQTGVGCGAHRLLVEAPSATFTCTASGAGTTRPITVTVQNTSGAVTYRLGPATTTPATTTPATTAPAGTASGG